jgi:hypothetical protein
MLEPQLAEKQHQEEAKLPHPEPPAHTKLLHTTLHKKTVGFSHCQAPALNLLGIHKPTGEQKSGKWYSHRYS